MHIVFRSDNPSLSHIFVVLYAAYEGRFGQAGSPEGDENPKGKKAAKEPGPLLWEGKHLAIITTCGYRPERGADLFEEGIKRYCRHSRLRYLGMLAERHMGYGTVFMDAEKESRAREFAKILAEA